jgi:hypothetical protein
MNNIEKFLYTWISQLIQVVSGIIGFITFTLWIPDWDLQFMYWYTNIQQQRFEKMMRNSK